METTIQQVEPQVPPSLKWSQSQMDDLSQWAGFLSFKPNFVQWALFQALQKSLIVFVETGNQQGKTANIVYQIVLGILGMHPVERMNMRPDNPIRIIRFCSESLPLETTENGEVKNTVYPQLKKFLPSSLIVRDVTVRKPSMAITDVQGGQNIIVEFSSYGQDVGTQAGHQRWIIFEDEEAPKGYHEEQIPRLIAAQERGTGGVLIMGLTPTQGISWTFEGIYNRAGIFYNSPTILKFLEGKEKVKHQMIEMTDGDPDIVVIRAATDDNPIFTKKVIERNVAQYEDEATKENRRYGIYHQVSGIIYGEYSPVVHFIKEVKYFPEGIPHNWLHARGIDFHEHTNWACGWIALSDQDEAFVYNEFNPSPDRNNTLQISIEVASQSKDYKYGFNLVDPRADIKQTNSNDTALNVINNYFRQASRDGNGTGGYWQTWDTKNLKGRDEIKKRLKNSLICERPFNNKKVENGTTSYLPTLWVLDSCPITSYQLKNWRWEQWANRDALVTKEEKNKAEDKNSHFPVMIECIMKDVRFRVRRGSSGGHHNPYMSYMRGR
jgi:hypothetical protein